MKRLPFLKGSPIGYGFFLLVFCAISLLVSTAHAADPKLSKEEQTAQVFETMRKNPNQLRAFFLRMPKGGDIHHHVTGAVYAESLIDLAVARGLCVNPDSGELALPPCDTAAGGAHFPLARAYSDAVVYNRLIDSWSIRNFDPNLGSAHDHFFAIFPRIDLATQDVGAILAELRSRAAKENLQYLETMLQVPETMSKVLELGRAVGWDKDLRQLYDLLMARGMHQLAAEVSSSIDRYDSECTQYLKCNSPQADPGCKVTVGYQYYTLRVLPKEAVYAQMVLAFEVASRNRRVVGVNMVGPEDDWTARRDYALHMEMLDVLHNIYPDVKIALHAGELVLGLVPPEDLRFHIRDAVHRGHARRIGHGVGIMYETGAHETLRDMVKNRIAVEVPLTSNQVLLDVVGEEHPLPMYLEQGVPVVLATDDPGIFRTDLSEEMVRAARSYPVVKYQDFKNLVRNSIEFSFLSGDSLWRDPGHYGQVQEVCTGDKPGDAPISAQCGSFLQNNSRAALQWQLEAALSQFEEETCSELKLSRLGGTD